MFLFLITLALIVIAVLAWFIPIVESGYGREPKVSHLPRVIPALILVFALLILALSWTTRVSAKNAGVLVTFGAVSDRTVGPGLHLKPFPWTKVIEIDGTNQTDRYNGDGKTEDTDNVTYSACIDVLLGDGGKSCASVTNRWAVNPDRANDAYANYRSDDPTKALRSNVVSTELLSAVQDVIGTYNPLANLQVVKGAKNAAAVKFTPNYDQLSRDLTAEMQRRLGDDPLVTIQKITVSFVPLPADTQRRINQFTGEVANTRTSAQRVQTATQQAAANKALSASLQKAGPDVLTSRCIDVLNEAIDKKYALPAGFNCLGGGGSAVVVPSK
jgi:regulator of protease activity HflC (stomatin/prohibitin superfamily)